MDPSTNLFCFGSGLIAAAFAMLVTKYYAAKVLIEKLDGALKFADKLITELSELISRINVALEDDTLSKEEIGTIMVELKDVVEKLKMAVKLVKNKEVPE